MKRFLLLSIAILLSFNYGIPQETKELTLEDLFGPERLRTATEQHLHSLHDGDAYAKIVNDSLNIYSFSKGNLIKTVITPGSMIPVGDSTPLKIQDFSFSLDETKVLLAADSERIYRRSSKSF